MPYPLVDFVLPVLIGVAADAVDQVAIIAPFDMEVVQIQERHKTGSTSGVLDVVVVPDGSLVSTGTTMLSATLDLSASSTSETLRTLSLSTALGARFIPKGSALGLKFTGTVTNLVNSSITIYYRQLRKNQTPVSNE